MTTLPTALAGDELPLPERMAALLDGELYALGDAHVLVDTVETPALRLAGVLAGRGPRLVAELGTAAWVWGAQRVAPSRVELCVALSARARSNGSRAGIREVVLGPGDVHALGGRRVTTPLRTAIDLARARDDFDGDVETVRMLAVIGDFSLADAIAELDSRRNLPARRRAESRLRRALSDRL